MFYTVEENFGPTTFHDLPASPTQPHLLLLKWKGKHSSIYKSLRRGNNAFSLILNTELFSKITEKNMIGSLELWCSVYNPKCMV